jgi:peroxiredoxin
MGLLTLSLFLVQCSDLNAEKVKKDVNDWFTDLITPRNSSLELANEGYIVKGNLKNKPNQKLALYEMTPENLIFIDSVITDKKGDFLLKGSTKELIFCALGVNEKQMIYLALDNSTEINVMIDATVSSLNYSLSGKNIEESVALKDLLKLNEGYVSKIKALETEASSLNPNTDAGFQRMSALQKDYYTTMAARSADMLKFAQDRPSSFIPFFILQFNVVQEPTIELLTAAKDAALKANPNSKYTEIIVQRYNDEARLMIGGVAPEINLAQPEGSNLALSSLRGKYVLIDFWASWCGPCRKENPNNVAMYNKYKDKGFEIYGVSLDQDPLRWKKAIEADGLTWKHVSDLKGWSSSAGQTYNIRSIPATVLIDPTGKIIAKGLRGEELEAKLAEILGQN